MYVCAVCTNNASEILGFLILHSFAFKICKKRMLPHDSTHGC